MPRRRFGRRHDPRGRRRRGPRRGDPPRGRRPRRDEHGEAGVAVLGGRPEVVVDQVGVDEPLEVLLGLVPLQVDHGDVRVLKDLGGISMGITNHPNLILKRAYIVTHQIVPNFPRYG